MVVSGRRLGALVQTVAAIRAVGGEGHAMQSRPITEASIAEDDQVFDHNVRRARLSMKYEFPVRLAGGGGATSNDASIAGAVIFLASAKSSFVTRHDLLVDRGYTVQ